MRTMIKALIVNSMISSVVAFIVFVVFASIVCAVIVFIIILLIGLVKPTLIILNILVQRTDWYKIKVGDGIKFRKQIDTNLDICNLGSNSGKYAFDYEETGLKGENWALGPQTLSYDFKVLKNYHSYLHEGGTVLIPLCPFSSCIIDFDDDIVNYKYYSFLHPILILNYSESTKNQILRFVDKPFQVKPLKSIFRIFKDVAKVNYKIMIEENLEKDANNFVNSWKQQFSILDMNIPISKKNNDSITFNTNLLSEMISFCIERNLKPVLILPPVTKVLSSKLSEGFRENYIYSFVRKSNNYNVKFLNYFDDKQFDNNELFFNSYFLNEKGSKLYTKRVLLDLGIIES